MDERSVHIYGPVASRRLGSSLGVDLVPRKTCDYDCVYCQLGRTTDMTTSREPYVPSDAVLEQLERKLNEYGGIDYITLAGSGEPTLNSELGASAGAVPPLSRSGAVSSLGSRTQKVLHLIRRRPCTADDVARALGINYTEAMKLLVQMEVDGKLDRRVREGKTFYIVP